ncbi:MAG TPA: hypothetical protein VEA92_01835 [Candidatus Paceibacterota bacterium]|nr:hypothetical protein [Candidatus Paceibacterota bacterium]
MAHAYLLTGDLEQGVSHATEFSERELNLAASDAANLTVLRYTNFTIDDVRDFAQDAYAAPTQGTRRAVILSASRLFHEAQNAMLKLFEEPPVGTTLFLVVPSEGTILPTLRSRLTPLPGTSEESGTGALFLALTQPERKKYLDKLYDRTRSDKQEEKREGRREALELAQSLTRELRKNEAFMKEGILADLVILTKILHDSSAPIKPIFEHLLLTLPASADMHR